MSDEPNKIIYSMLKVSRFYDKKPVIKDISLSFFYGAKIGVLGLNGSGKSTLLKIMAGVDTDIEGEAVPMAGLRIGYLPQEPQLDPAQTVREAVEEGLGGVLAAKKRLEEVYVEYGDADADFDKLAEEQAQLEAIIAAGEGDNTDLQMEVAADIANQLRNGEDHIMGVMVESHLVEGRQDKPVTYGQSITDACIGWADTEALLAELAEANRGRV